MITILLIVAIVIVSVYNIIMATILYKVLNQFEIRAITPHSDEKGV